MPQIELLTSYQCDALMEQFPITIEFNEITRWTISVTGYKPHIGPPPPPNMTRNGY